MSAAAPAAPLGRRKCCGKCRRWKDPARMRKKRTPSGGTIYVCDTCRRPRRRGH